ncbi:unnamed protein product [Gulo gulo]|uniref:Uncharacterized protein n=1 Tax=Gulo gulo TaxID=48420 RepID=A0A9X9PX05_GULGU|nr:unnamed protein product [Gulo gulo]
MMNAGNGPAGAGLGARPDSGRLRRTDLGRRVAAEVPCPVATRGIIELQTREDL